ncbi:unnamed protein product [Closterium sp. Naga37s-1]|nr:unnamed protein product [Closterium sp. Naga37s-1]
MSNVSLLPMAAGSDDDQQGMVSESPIRRTAFAAVMEAEAPEKLVARVGRSHQRYAEGVRLVAGCIPFRVLNEDQDGRQTTEQLQVLMITSQHGEGLIFPKGGWETDETAEQAACREAMEEAGVRGIIQGRIGSWMFKSKRLRTAECKDGECCAHMFSLAVAELLTVWPEMSRRSRHWVSIPEAIQRCRHDWMRDALRQWCDQQQPVFKLPPA